MNPIEIKSFLGGRFLYKICGEIFIYWYSAYDIDSEEGKFFYGPKFVREVLWN